MNESRHRMFTWEPATDGLRPFACNSPLWRITEMDGLCLALLDNMELDEEGGRVALCGDPSWSDIVVTAEMRYVRGRMPEHPLRGWFGLVLRAQDTDNYELFWLMPHHGGEAGAVAYVPVAHGIVPWWTEAYRAQTQGRADIPPDAWIPIRAEVRGRNARIFVNGALTLEKTLTYYLRKGRVGLYVGTLTDAAFRNIVVEAINV